MPSLAGRVRAVGSWAAGHVTRDTARLAQLIVPFQDVASRMPPRPDARVLRDMKARQGVANNQISRRAYPYVARNQSLPAQVRYQAQLQVNGFGRYTRPTTVKNRCTVTGRGRGVMGEFGLCRVSQNVLFFYVPYA